MLYLFDLRSGEGGMQEQKNCQAMYGSFSHRYLRNGSKYRLSNSSIGRQEGRDEPVCDITYRVAENRITQPALGYQKRERVMKKYIFIIQVIY